MTHVAATEPYPWPYDDALEGATIALVLAGWDTAWFARADPVEAAAAAGACGQLADATVAAGGAVLTVAHRGASPLPPVHRDACSVAATGLDGFWGGPLDDRLRASGRRYLLVAGHGLEGPVHSLLRGANDRGYECLLVLDASSASAPELRAASASMVCMSGGIFGAIGSLASALDALTALTPIPTGAFP
jgi:biuret amidohydrolase